MITPNWKQLRCTSASVYIHTRVSPNDKNEWTVDSFHYSFQIVEI